MALEHTDIDPEDMVLHHSDGCELREYDGQENIFDLVTTDPPYLAGAERYTDDDRCLGNIKDQDLFLQRMELCPCEPQASNKPSNWEKKNISSNSHQDWFSLVVEKEGLVEMCTPIENLAKQHGLVLHDKVINVLNSHWGLFNVRRCMDYRYGVKKHETNLVFLKYD